jgi:hypothetical protein
MEIGGEVTRQRSGETGCRKYREAAGAIEPPSEVGRTMLKTRCPTGCRARIMLWFSGKSKQSVVLNTQAFADATEYIPAQVLRDICEDAVCHALRTF